MRAWTGFNWLRIERWHAFLNAVMNFRIPYSEEIFWLVVDLLDSQERRCSMKLLS